MSEVIDVEVDYDRVIEWCKSRRQLNDNWTKTTQEIATALSNFYKLAAEHQVELPIVEEKCDYYSCKLMLNSLLSTRDNSKTLLRSYTDPILNALSSIISLYEKDNTYIADSAIRLKQVVSYELVSLGKQIKENESALEQIVNRITELKRNVSRKEEAISSIRKEWNITTTTLTLDAFMEDLLKTESELTHLQNQLQTCFQSPTLSSSLHYFLCQDAYAGKKDTLDSSDFAALQQCITAADLHLLEAKETRERVLDDLYCLASFYQEKIRSATNEHTIVLGCSDSIANTLNSTTVEMVKSYSQVVNELITLLEGRFTVVSQLLKDVCYRQDVAQEVLNEYTRLDGFNRRIQEAEEKKKLVVQKMEAMKQREKELKQYAKKLTKNVEESMSGLFKQLQVTIVGAIRSLYIV